MTPAKLYSFMKMRHISLAVNNDSMTKLLLYRPDVQFKGHHGSLVLLVDFLAQHDRTYLKVKVKVSLGIQSFGLCNTLCCTQCIPEILKILNEM